MSTQQGQAPYYFVPGPSKWPVLMGAALLVTMAGASAWVNGIGWGKSVNIAGIIAALDLDFFDPVEITTNQPGNSTLQQTLQVFGVQHRVTPNFWKTKFTTLEPIIDGFILDSTLYGVLDTSVLAY